MKLFESFFRIRNAIVIPVCILYSTSLFSQQTLHNTWSAGDLPLDYNSDYEEYTPEVGCAGQLTITLPTGGFYEVTGIDVEYDIMTVGDGWKIEQRSRIHFTNGSTSGNWYAGEGYEGGTQHYVRNNVTIANNTYPGGTDLKFELQAFRTYYSSHAECNMEDQKILNNSWKITVHFKDGEEITCPAPADLSAGNITAATAGLSWNETGSATEWEVKYGPTGFDPETEGTLISGQNSASTSLSGLQDGTSYDFYVRSVCSTDDVSNWSGPGNFTTEYEPIHNDVCSGAVELSIGSDESGTTHGATSTITDCNSGKEVWYTFTGTGSPIKVELETTFGDGILALFKGNSCHEKTKVDCHEFYPDAGGSYTFDSESGTNYFLSIGAYQDAYIPANEYDFMVRLSEGCGLVDHLQITGYPDDQSATLTWDGPATDAEYQIQYGINDDYFTFDADQTLNDITGSGYTLAGLESGTDYDVRIRTKCDDGEYSEWTTGYFTTHVQTVDNDLCSNAKTINCGNAYIDQPLSGATAQNSPVYDHCASSIPGVWYVYTHTGSSDQDIKLSFSHFDPKTIGIGVRLSVSVITGTNCSLDELVSCFEVDKYSNDDKSFTAHPGEAYYIYVASGNLSDYSNVNFDMEVSCGTFTADDNGNDICSDAEILECDDTDDGSTDNATDNLDDAVSNIGRGKWFKFTGDGKSITLTIGPDEEDYFYEDIDFNGYLAAGNCASLTRIASLNSTGDEKYTFATTDGTTYYLYVGAAGNDSYETGPFKVSITCSDCLPVTLLHLLDHTDREARFSWDYKANFSNWTIKLGPVGFDPETGGTTINNDDVIESQFYYLNIHDLTPDTDYDLYVRADCDEDNISNWEKVSFTTDEVPAITNLSCSERLFTDTGGEDGGYSAFEDYGLRISGSNPYVLFTKSEIEDNIVYGCEDFLSIYNGSSFASSPINANDNTPHWCGDALRGELFHGSNGNLTFKFHSNSRNNQAGWEALVACDGDFAKTNSQNNCLTSGTVGVGYGSGSEWYHLYTDEGILIASVQPMSGSVGNVSASAFISSQNRELDEYTPYLDRSYVITTTSSGTAKVRLYLTSDEANNLISRSTAAGSISDFTVIHTNQSCGEPLNNCTPEIVVTGTGELGHTPYVEIQTSSFGAYYIAAKDEGTLTFNSLDTTLYLDKTGMANITTEELVPGLAGNCHVKSVSGSPLTFDCDDTGEKEVIITVMTNDNQTIQKTVHVTVADKSTPSFTSTPPSHIHVDRIDDIPEVFNVTYEDNCSANMDFEEIRKEAGCGYHLERIWTITDPSENSSQFQQTVVYNGNLQQELQPVAHHMTGLESGDTLHLVDCIPYDIEGSDLNAGNDPNASIATHIYRLPLEENHEQGLIALFHYEYIVSNDCGQSSTFDYFLKLYDLHPPLFQNFPSDTAISGVGDLPSVSKQVRILDVCNYVQWDTVITFPVIDPETMDTLSFVRRWTAADPSGNLSHRDQYINLNSTKRDDFSSIDLRIGKDEDIHLARFPEGTGTNGILVLLKRYDVQDSLVTVDSMMTNSWYSQRGSAFFTPVTEGTYRLQIHLPEGYSVKPGPDSLFTAAGLSHKIQLAHTVLDLGLITLNNTPPLTDSTNITDGGNMSHPQTLSHRSPHVSTRIYPNPSNGLFKVDFDTKAPMNYYIRDVSGRLLAKGALESGQFIDISSQPRGVYTIQLLEGNKMVDTQKVILME